MLGRTPEISQQLTLKDGVLADFVVTEEMIKHFIKKVHKNAFANPRILIVFLQGQRRLKEKLFKTLL